MTQNIEQRTEAAVKKYERASVKVNEIAHTDADIETGVGSRKSFPKISREWNDESQRLQKQWNNDSAVIRQDWQNERNELSTKALGVKTWEPGQTENNINQQRRWTDNHTYLPKTVPALMGASGPDDNWIPYTADKSDTLNDVFGRKPVDLLDGITIAPDSNSQYPKLNAFGKVWELSDGSDQLIVKNFVESIDGYLVITLFDDSQVIALHVTGASRTWVAQNTEFLVSSFEAARTIYLPPTARSIKTLGYDEEGDGVSYVYALSGTGTPGDTDKGGYFVDLSGRKWVLQYDDVIHVKAWGVNASRSAYENALRIRAAFEFGGNGKHYDLGDKDYGFTEVWLNKNKATIRGSGTYDGEILVRHSAYLVTRDTDMDFDIKLSMKTSDNTKSAVKYHYCSKGVSVIDGDGYNVVHHAIHHSKELGPSWGQPVRRVKYGGAYRNVNYFIKGESSEDNNISFTMADITLIPSTEGTALISHVDIDTIDGFTCHSQVQFFPGFQTGNQTKKHNIKIRKYTWANIADNKLFESGEEAVLLIDGARLIMHDNQYAWPGQRKPTYAVVIDGLPLTGEYFSQSIIHDENIIRPSLGGIIVKAKSGRLKIHDTETHYPGRNERYYGDDPIPEGDKYGIYVDNDTIDVKTHDNYVRRGEFFLPGGIGQSNSHKNNVEDLLGDGSGVVAETVARTLSLKENTSIIDVRRFSIVNIAQPSLNNITEIHNTKSETKLVVFRAYNSNTTLVHSESLALKGSQDVKIPNRGIITLLCMSDGTAVEQSRSF